MLKIQLKIMIAFFYIFLTINLSKNKNIQDVHPISNSSEIKNSIECDNDIASLLKGRKLSEGENTICTIKGTKSQLIAVVKNNKLVSWKTINENRQIRETNWNYTIYKSAKGKKKQPELTLELGEVRMLECTTISGSLPDGSTFTLTICKP